MDDAGAEGIAGLRERLAAAKKCVDERALGIASAGVNGHASGFVDGDDVVVFVKDVEWDGFGFGLEGRAGLGVDLDRVAGADFLGVFSWLAVEEDEVLFDEFLDAGAGECGAMGGDEAIKAEAGFGGGDEENYLRGGGHGESVARGERFNTESTEVRAQRARREEVESSKLKVKRFGEERAKRRDAECAEKRRGNEVRK